MIWLVTGFGWQICKNTLDTLKEKKPGQKLVTINKQLWLNGIESELIDVVIMTYQYNSEKLFIILSNFYLK